MPFPPLLETSNQLQVKLRYRGPELWEGGALTSRRVYECICTVTPPRSPHPAPRAPPLPPHACTHHALSGNRKNQPIMIDTASSWGRKSSSSQPKSIVARRRTALRDGTKTFDLRCTGEYLRIGIWRTCFIIVYIMG
ncbi:unnamed protein product [Colias eurytheme]|nr:unnamed protein product [Colias eurytheme]